MESMIGRPPASNDRFHVPVDFHPYSHQAFAARWLDDLQVQVVSAFRNICTKKWKVLIRRAPDEHVFCITAGRGVVYARGLRHEVGPGDVVYWHEGEERVMEQDPEHTLRFIVLHMLTGIGGGRSLGLQVQVSTVSRLGIGHPVFALADEAARAFTLCPPGWRTECNCLLQLFMLTFLREPRVSLRVVETFGEAFAAIRPAVDAMNRQLDMAISLSALARRCNLSSAQFRRVFHRALGCSPRTYLQRLRLSEAKRRLVVGNDTIEAIAHAIGYSTTSFFNAVFKREIGMRPGDYRQMSVNQSTPSSSDEPLAH